MKIRIEPASLFQRHSAVGQIFNELVGAIELEFDENAGPFPHSEVIEGQYRVLEDNKQLKEGETCTSS